MVRSPSGGRVAPAASSAAGVGVPCHLDRQGLHRRIEAGHVEGADRQSLDTAALAGPAERTQTDVDSGQGRASALERALCVRERLAGHRRGGVHDEQDHAGPRLRVGMVRRYREADDNGYHTGDRAAIPQPSMTAHFHVHANTPGCRSWPNRHASVHNALSRPRRPPHRMPVSVWRSIPGSVCAPG